MYCDIYPANAGSNGSVATLCHNTPYAKSAIVFKLYCACDGQVLYLAVFQSAEQTRRARTCTSRFINGHIADGKVLPIKSPSKCIIILSTNRYPIIPVQSNAGHQIDGLAGKVRSPIVYQFSEPEQIVSIPQLIHCFGWIIPTGVCCVGFAHGIGVLVVTLIRAYLFRLVGSINRHTPIGDRAAVQSDCGAACTIDILCVAIRQRRCTVSVYQLYDLVVFTTGLSQ